MLQTGQIIKLSTGLHKVLDVNENRAIVKPLDKCKRDFTTRFGKQVKFESYQNSFAISAESQVAIVKTSEVYASDRERITSEV